MPSTKPGRSVALSPFRSMYAIAAYDRGILYLVLRIVRNKRGEVFYVLPRDDREGWDPHGSRHADGSEHYKSFDQRFMRRQRQVPSEGFQGSENLVTIPLYLDTMTQLCRENDFDGVYPIPLSEIKSDCPPMLAVDLTEPYGSPIVTPGARIICQFTIKDCIPWSPVL